MDIKRELGERKVGNRERENTQRASALLKKQTRISP
jgi:hypothetical protein